MASHSPTTIPRVREYPAHEHAAGDLVPRGGAEPTTVVPVRRVMVTAGASTAAFIALSTTPYVNEALTVQSSFGVELLAVELFWLAAAAMGAAFAMLLSASGIVARREGRSDGLQFVAGAMAGFLLVALLPVDVGSRPMVAVLGAFFASMAFRLLPGGRTPPHGNGGDHATQEP